SSALPLTTVTSASNRNVTGSAWTHDTVKGISTIAATNTRGSFRKLPKRENGIVLGSRGVVNVHYNVRSTVTATAQKQCVQPPRFLSIRAVSDRQPNLPAHWLRWHQ